MHTLHTVHDSDTCTHIQKDTSSHTQKDTHTHAAVEIDSTTDACAVRAFCCPHPNPWGHPLTSHYTHSFSTLHTTAPPANHPEQNNQTDQSQRQDYNNWWLTGGISMVLVAFEVRLNKYFSLVSELRYMRACGRWKKCKNHMKINRKTTRCTGCTYTSETCW